MFVGMGFAVSVEIGAGVGVGMGVWMGNGVGVAIGSGTGGGLGVDTNTAIVPAMPAWTVAWKSGCGVLDAVGNAFSTAAWTVAPMSTVGSEGGG